MLMEIVLSPLPFGGCGARGGTEWASAHRMSTQSNPLCQSGQIEYGWGWKSKINEIHSRIARV